jgi:hypothetical protein
MNSTEQLESMVEICLNKPDDFLILKETLTRIGLPSEDKTELYQTCHILYKRRRYYIVHFKEMFKLDGLPSNMTVTDVARRNSIVNYLLQHNYFKLVSGEGKLEPSLPRTATRNGETVDNNDFTIIPFTDRKRWKLVPKYVIGSQRNRPMMKTKTAAAH